MKNLQTEILIVGAGPSGLTAGFKLIDKKEFIIIEKSPNYVGGISRTEKYKNFKFDIGGGTDFSVNLKKLINFGTKFYRMILY